MEDKDLNSEQTPLDDIAQKCEEYLAGWKRAQADYANLKRDSDRERIESAKYANERLLSDLLPAIDQFEIALDFLPDISQLPDDQRKKLENWFVGVKAVRGLWETAFKDIGLEKVNTSGSFDPVLHEAVGQEPSEAPEGSIIRVVQPGWMLSGKLLRPAKVIIAKANS